MKSCNLNAVLLIAATAALNAGAQVFATKTKETTEDGNKFRVDFKLADGTSVNGDDVVEFELTDAASVAKFNALFDNLPTVKGGFYSYVNSSGPTNPTIFKTFDPQGLGKIMAQALQAAHLIISQGGAEATKMSAILDGILEYNEVAAAQIAERKAASLMDEIAKLNIPAEKKREMLAALGTGSNTDASAKAEKPESKPHAEKHGGKNKGKGKVPAATVAENEATEPTEAISA